MRGVDAACGRVCAGWRPWGEGRLWGHDAGGGAVLRERVLIGEGVVLGGGMEEIRYASVVGVVSFSAAGRKRWKLQLEAHLK